MKQIILPHPRKQSRKVTENDLEVVRTDAVDLLRICYEPIGLYPGAMAMAHVQIEAEDPLRFFVKKNGEIIINPKVIEQKQTYKHLEGCMSFPTKTQKKVERHNIITVEYVSSDGNDIDLNSVKTEQFSGIDAAIFQHEIEHFNLQLIY